MMPYCRIEVELSSVSEDTAVQYALQGSRRIGVIDGSSGYDADARPMGVCFEIENVERLPQRWPRIRLLGKHRFWLVEAPQEHQDGFELGRCETFFDEARPLADLVLTSASPEASPAMAADADSVADTERRQSTADVAKEALELLEIQLVRVGQGGRRAFHSKFGDLPTLRTGGGEGTTSANLEMISFWLLGALVTDSSNQRRWLGSLDTHGRLEDCRSRLQSAGTRPILNLPGASSFMHPGQSMLSSFGLLVLIVALLLAKALGIFDKTRRGGVGDHSSLEDTWIFGQLLR